MKEQQDFKQRLKQLVAEGLEDSFDHTFLGKDNEIIKYELQSHRGKTVDVPKVYAEIAQAITNHVINGKCDQDTRELTNYFIGNVGILGAYTKLTHETRGF